MNSWEELEEENPREEFEALAPWISYLVTRRRHLVLYNRLVARFWVTKGLLGYVIVAHNAKHQGDETPVHYWKEQ